VSVAPNVFLLVAFSGEQLPKLELGEIVGYVGQRKYGIFKKEQHHWRNTTVKPFLKEIF
jgi:hypothetical protein